MKRRKILFVSYFYPPAAGMALPGTQRSLKFVRHLEQLDKFVLTVLPGAYPNYFKMNHPAALPIAGEKIFRTGVFDFFQFLVACKNKLLFRRNGKASDAGAGAPATEQGGGTETSDGRKGLFQKFKDIVSEILTYPDVANCWIFPAVRAGRAIVKKEGIDYIFATGKPWSALLVAFLIKRDGVKLVIDFRDPWVNNPFERGLSEFHKKVDEYLEKKVVRKADWVFLNTEYLRQEFISRYGQNYEDKFITVTNGFDANDFQSDNAGVKKINDNAVDSSRLVLTHAGLLYGLRDPISIFQAFAKCYQMFGAETARNIKLRQVGGISLDYNFQKYIHENCSEENFEDIGQVPYSECLNLLSMSDILLIIQPDTKTQIPSKLYEYIYLNKPILTIAPKDGALGKMIKKYGFGDIYNPEDIEGIAQYFAGKLVEKQKNGTLFCEYHNRDEFDVKNITAKFEKLLLEGVQ
jgi:hypothetical protein